MLLPLIGSNGLQCESHKQVKPIYEATDLKLSCISLLLKQVIMVLEPRCFKISELYPGKIVYLEIIKCSAMNTACITAR